MDAEFRSKSKTDVAIRWSGQYGRFGLSLPRHYLSMVDSATLWPLWYEIDTDKAPSILLTPIQRQGMRRGTLDRPLIGLFLVDPVR